MVLLDINQLNVENTTKESCKELNTIVQKPTSIVDIEMIAGPRHSRLELDIYTLLYCIVDRTKPHDDADFALSPTSWTKVSCTFLISFLFSKE